MTENHFRNYAILGKIFLKKLNQVKLDKIKNILISVTANFWRDSAKKDLYRGDWTRLCVYAVLRSS